MRFLSKLASVGMICLAVAGCGLFIEEIPSGRILCPTAKDHYIRIGDINYHYLEYPAGGEDIVFLHGFASSTYTWEEVAACLQKAGYHVWALDMKGFGWSDKPEEGRYDPVTLMGEVNRWMEDMGLEQATIVGNSLGGGIAVLMTLEHPERVGRLVLIDAAGYPIEKPLIVRMAQIPLSRFFAKLFFARWAVRWNLEEVFYHSDRVTEERIDAYYARMRTSGSLDAQIAVARALNGTVFEKYTRRIPEIGVRTLIIWGKEDQWIPLESGYRFRVEIVSSTLVVIPECGHLPQEEHPLLTARLIGGFIEGESMEGRCSGPGQASKGKSSSR